MHYTDQKVLLVDDDATMLELLRHGLSADNDLYEVMCAKNAQEAIEFLERIHFPLVVVDIQMPTMSGLDLLAKIRELWPHVKIILMTGSPSRQLQEEIQRSDCLKLFQKPIRMEELRALIAKELTAPTTGEQGFAGRLTNIKLSDLIQMCCSSGISTVIQVRKNRTVGMVFVEEGEIIHADCGETEGINAFYEIFSWQSGSFETLGDVAVPKNTIDKNWQYLIMEGHRRMDETQAASLAASRDERDETNESNGSDLPEACLKLSIDETGERAELENNPEWDGEWKGLSIPETMNGPEKTSERHAVGGLPAVDRVPFRVLIVDDSTMMCRVLTEILSSDECIQVVGTAQNGEEALEQIDRLRPDLITLDVNMPVMGGSTALKHIMIRNPCPVVIVSAVNHRLESNILNFLLLGAVDYIQKPVRGEEMARHRLIQAVRRAARARTDRFRRAKPARIVTQTTDHPKPLTSHHSLVLVCSGAGGYAELVRILPLIPAGFGGAMVVMQSMSHSFGEPFAAYLDQRSHVQVRLLSDAMGIFQGHCYLASDERPLRFRGEGGIYVLGGDAGGGLPDVGMPDLFLTSAAETFMDRLLVVLLSGVDTGSLSGLREIRNRGGRIISQSIRDCLVPQPLEAAHEAGLISAAMGIEEIVSEMIHASSRPGCSGE